MKADPPTSELPRLQDFDERRAGLQASRCVSVFQSTRSFSIELARPLTPEDCAVQSMPDASPITRHLAHTTRFFEKFVLPPRHPEAHDLAPADAHLFGFHDNTHGPTDGRDRRGVNSHPTLAEILAYRRRLDEEVERFLQHATASQLHETIPLLLLGLNHEQQHQELMLTDIKHALRRNPLHPAYAETTPSRAEPVAPLRWRAYDEGAYWIGADEESGFSFDHERPRHREFVSAFLLADRLVTNGEFAEFIEDGGYRRPELWLSAGWAVAQEHRWTAPLYWRLEDALWHEFTLTGDRALIDAEPVCHVSYFEADAYARWAGARLPTEAEWEVAARAEPVEGNFVECAHWHPRPAPSVPAPARPERLSQAFGDVWEWTRSSYAPYPDNPPLPGAMGDSDGAFMGNQMVLRGGSCATPRSHMRATYRKVLPPEKRWQFSGIRLARDTA